MTTLPVLPSELWHLRDAAIEHVLTNAPLPSDFERLQEWLEGEWLGWEGIEEIALNFYGSSFYDRLGLSDLLSDDELRAREGLRLSAPVSDGMRVEFFRGQVESVISDFDSLTMPSVHSYRLERDDGKSAVLGYVVEIHGQSGPFTIRQGVFATRDAFHVHLRESGFRLLEEVEALDDAGILDVWHSVQEARKEDAV